MYCKTTLAHKNSVLLLDAYDEIKDINKDDFIRELKAFVKEFPNILLIISSRKILKMQIIFQIFNHFI